MKRWIVGALLVGALPLGVACAAAQDQQAFLSAGEAAPDIEFVAAARDGVLGPRTLSDYRGETVVLAFFFRARTPG